MSDYPDFDDIYDEDGYYKDPQSAGKAIQRLLDAIRRIEAKLDAMEHRLLPPGCLCIPKPEITPAGQTANVCISDPFHVAETHTEDKP